MLPHYVTKSSLDYFIRHAINEDLGDGDHSSLAAIPENTISKAQMLSKDEGILAGIELAKRIFLFQDPEIEIDLRFNDGDEVKKGDVLMIIKGKTHAILSSERLVLNCVQRMSGIATRTHQMIGLIKGTKVKLLDTRKTTPNFRLPEKWAVVIGGGENHRVGLYDMIMLKDNHIKYGGGITNAIRATQQYLREQNKHLKIEVEVSSLEEVKEVLAVGGVDIIMLDNMMPSKIKEAVALIDGKVKIEASGGITENNIKEVAACGVDYISVGALTHSAKSLDISINAL